MEFRQLAADTIDSDVMQAQVGNDKDIVKFLYKILKKGALQKYNRVNFTEHDLMEWLEKDHAQGQTVPMFQKLTREILGYGQQLGNNN